MGMEFHFCKMQRVLEVDFTTVWMYLTPNYILKWLRWSILCYGYFTILFKFHLIFSNKKIDIVFWITNASQDRLPISRRLLQSQLKLRKLSLQLFIIPQENQQKRYFLEYGVMSDRSRQHWIYLRLIPMFLLPMLRCLMQSLSKEIHYPPGSGLNWLAAVPACEGINLTRHQRFQFLVTYNCIGGTRCLNVHLNLNTYRPNKCLQKDYTMIQN